MTISDSTARPSAALRLPSDAEVVDIIRRHLHPETGSPFWVDRDARLGTRSYERIDGLRAAEELLSFMDADDQLRYEEACRRFPVEHFIPRDVVARRDRLWVSQTGGTTGLPKHGTWGGKFWDDTYHVTETMLALHGVPENVNWLFIGPTGPHTTGRLVIDMAERRGGSCFSIDLDPRIVKVFGEEGMGAAYDRYVRHIWDQVLAVLESQSIDVIFCTSRLLEQMPSFIDPDDLAKRVKAILHAGTTMTPETHRLLREQLFPGIPIVGMYGTSTTGISYQKPFEPEDDYRVIYVPSSPSLLLEVMDEQGRVTDFGADGQVRVWRLTEDQLLPGFAERDRATRIEPYGRYAEHFPWAWIGDPYSPEFTVHGRVEGVY